MKQFADYPEEIRERAIKLAFKIEVAIENVVSDFEPTEEELDCLDAYWGWASRSQIRGMIETLMSWAKEEEEILKEHLKKKRKREVKNES